MDSSRLNELSTDTLMTLQAAVAAVLATRLDTTLRCGRIGTFEHPIGVKRRLMITKVNQKTVSGEETHDSHNPGGKWKVGFSSLKIEPITRKQPLAPPPSVALSPHKPATASVAHEVW